jgi:hypothetical protein
MNPSLQDQAQSKAEEANDYLERYKKECNGDYMAETELE